MHSGKVSSDELTHHYEEVANNSHINQERLASHVCSKVFYYYYYYYINIIVIIKPLSLNTVNLPQLI